MEVFRFNISNDEDLNRQERFKQQINLCPSCSTPVSFETSKIPHEAQIEEFGFCDCCGHRESKLHTLN